VVPPRCTLMSPRLRSARVHVYVLYQYVHVHVVLSAQAHLFLDTLRRSQGSRPAADYRTQGYFRGPSPQDVALRGMMQALVRIQAYTLADIVVAIPAVDLAIEAVV
jgi:hypothetical protein